VEAFRALVLQRLEVAFQDVLDMVAYPQPPGAVAASHQARVHPPPSLDLQDPVVHALQVLLLLPPYQLPSRHQDQPWQLALLLHVLYPLAVDLQL